MHFQHGVFIEGAQIQIQILGVKKQLVGKTLGGCANLHTLCDERLTRGNQFGIWIESDVDSAGGGGGGEW